MITFFVGLQNSRGDMVTIDGTKIGKAGDINHSFMEGHLYANSEVVMTPYYGLASSGQLTARKPFICQHY